MNKQVNNTQNVLSILNRLKSVLNIDMDSDLASALSVKNNVLSNWKTRNSMDFQSLFTLCEEKKLDLNFIITGKKRAPEIGNSENAKSQRTSKHDTAVHFSPFVVTINSQNEDIVTIVPYKAAAGYLNGYADPEYIENLPALAAPGFRGGLHRGFEIRGNSMPPIHNGAISIGRFEEDLNNIRDRRLYIIVTRNEGIVLKRVINSPKEKKLILISDNANKREFPNYTVDYEDILQIWYWRAALIREVPDPSDIYNRLNDLEAKITILEENYKSLKSKKA